MTPWHIVGLDLGQIADFSALAVLEVSENGPQPARLAVRHLHRWQLGTKYTVIVEDVKALVARKPLSTPALAVDGTGVGTAVVDMFAEADMPARVLPVIITGGSASSVSADGRVHVPKKELVSALQVALQNRRLDVSPDLAEASTLIREMSAFRVKMSLAGNETFAAWRERDHDDLVLAVAMCCWLAEAAMRGGDGGEAEPESEVAYT